MTEKRKQYLASISKEERAIRRAIKYQQEFISLSKKDLANPWIFTPCGSILKRQITECKGIIKALKKQLPAPVKFIRDGKWAYNSCSVCKDAVNEDELYCHTCGQKLR